MYKRRIALLLGCCMTLISPLSAAAQALESAGPMEMVPVNTVYETEDEVLDIGGSDDLLPLLSEQASIPEALPEQEIAFSGDNVGVAPETEGNTLFEEEALPVWESDPAATVGNVVFDAEVRVKEEAWMFINGFYLLEKPENYGEIDPGLVSSTEDAYLPAEESVFQADFQAEEAFSEIAVEAEAAEESVFDAGLFTADEEPLFGDFETSDLAEEPVEAMEEAAAVELQEEEPAPAQELFTDAQVGIDKDRFFTLDDGLVRVITTTNSGKTHTGVYAFNETGALVVGGEVTIGSDIYYMRSESEAKMDSGVVDVSKTPYNSTYGQVVTDSWRWAGEKDEKCFRRYGADGKLIPIPVLLEQFQEMENFKGYFSIGKEGYWLDDDGVPQTGTYTLTDGKGVAHTFYFQDEKDESSGRYGEMFHDGWIKDTTKNGERWRYFSPEADTLGQLWVHGVVAALLENDTYYLLSKGGYYILDSCKKGENGSYYHSKADGSLYTSELAMYKDVYYYYLEDGTRADYVNSYHKVKSDNLYYYFGSTPGAIQQSYGWKYIVDGDTGKEVGWFFFAEDGKTLVSSWVSNNTRYLNAEGKLCSGLEKVEGDYYYFLPSTSTEYKGTIVTNRMLKSGDTYYYAGEDGKLVKKGWVTYNKNYYYLKDYKCLTNQRKKYEGVYGWLCETGKYLPRGWNVVSNEKNLVRYVNKKGFLLTSTTAKISGMNYYFDSNGYRKNDLTSVVVNDYYLICDRANGVINVYNAALTIPVKSIRCSVGRSSYPTPTGKYKLKTSNGGRWVKLDDGTYAQYGTAFGSYMIHSVPLATQTINGVPKETYNALGTPITYGNIYVCVADAKWIYEHCNGATMKVKSKKVVADEALKGHLGRNALVPMTSTYDPTDPLGGIQP